MCKTILMTDQIMNIENKRSNVIQALSEIESKCKSYVLKVSKYPTFHPRSLVPISWRMVEEQKRIPYEAIVSTYADVRYNATQ